MKPTPCYQGLGSSIRSAMAEGREILIDRSPGETRVAIVDHENLIEFHIERDHAPSRLGEIVLARVTGSSRDADAAFLDLGQGLDGFLKFGSTTAPHQGAAIVVQITAPATEDKAARASREIDLHGSFVTLTPNHAGHAVSGRITAKGERNRLHGILDAAIPPELGAIARRHSQGIEDSLVRKDAEALATRWRDIEASATEFNAPATLWSAGDLANRVRAAHPDLSVVEGKDGALFAERGLEEEIETALARTLQLDGGGRLTFDETKALCAIDVDTDRAPTGGSAGLKQFNVVAATLIARQIRLRATGGLIVIDFPRMTAKTDREAVSAHLRACFEADPATPTLHGWTKAGLFEITRRRQGPSLAEQLLAARNAAAPSPETTACLALRQLLSVARGRPHPVLACADPIAQVLTGSLASAYQETNRRLGGQVTIQVMAGYEASQFEILDGRPGDG